MEGVPLVPEPLGVEITVDRAPRVQPNPSPSLASHQRWENFKSALKGGAYILGGAGTIGLTGLIGASAWKSLANGEYKKR